MRIANGDARLHGRVATRVFVGNQWLLAVDTSLGKLHVAQPNYGAPPPGEGEEVGLAWTDDDLRVLSEVLEVRAASCTIQQRVMRGTEVLTAARVTAAFVREGRPTRQPRAWVEVFRRLTEEGD